jgi:prolipoprotein diacylglyceryltransferase
VLFRSAVAFLIFIAFARIGCLLHGCCSGRPVARWGLALRDTGGSVERRVPTQLLDAFASLALLSVIVGVGFERLRPGLVLLVTGAVYATARVLVEFTRARRPRGRALSYAQWGWCGVATACAFVVLLQLPVLT